MFLFIPVCSGTFPTALILLLFLVFKKNKKEIFCFQHLVADAEAALALTCVRKVDLPRRDRRL